ncbi:MAG: protoglobin domain-containing protein [Bacteroidia bacterium]|nr:protoglobin domain-containing protein [Bacteroidia bacterium]MDW8158722.1 protoglobin domain-containing protein [Bacteroidia bacterium]
MQEVKGYDYGKATLVTSPITLQDLALLKKTLLWQEEDDKYLKMAGEVLSQQLEDILDLWYNYVGSNEHLVYYFSKDNQPISDYLSAVRARFKQWILDLCQKDYDQNWLNYQYEIALRHHSTKKNQTDGVEAPAIVHCRYLIAFIYPITATIKSFLAKSNYSQTEIEGMYNAWFKAVVLTAVLWCYPYIKSEEF